MRRAGKPIPPQAAALARVTVQAAVGEFLIQLEREAAAHREQYVERYRADLNLYVIPKDTGEIEDAAQDEPPRILWQPGWRYVDEITTAAWNDESLRLHKSNGGPLGFNSIRHLANTLRHLLRFCVRKGYLQNEPVLKSPPNKLVKKERRFRRPMTERERERFIRRLYAYAPQPRAKGRQKSHPLGTAARFYELMHFSLLRRGEEWALTLRWVDRRARLIHLPPEHTKSGDAEDVALTKRAEAAIFGQVKAAGIKARDKDTPIFGTINVRPAFEWAMKTARIDPRGITPHHHARHTGGTILAKKTRSRDQLKQAGRWRSDQSVEPYLHVGAEDARELMDKL